MDFDVVAITKTLVAVPSIDGDDGTAINCVEKLFTEWGWSTERIAVDERGDNIFVSFGTPKVVFTTHLDVVPAEEEQFQPTICDNKLYGRGACDAKGQAAAMIVACGKLLQEGHSDFGLLLVIAEETDGKGARVAAEALKNRGIQYIVNGEPTECLLASAQKGLLGLYVTFPGKSCHSGYPELGADANEALIRFSHALYNLDLGEDSVLGRSTVNIGSLTGGTAANVLAAEAKLSCNIRTVTENSSVLKNITELKDSIAPDATIEVYYDCPPVTLYTLPNFETAPMLYCSDVPHFAPLGATMLMYGPGSIHQAHTIDEYIEIEELERAVSGYVEIFKALS